jgi:hypothetical protein
MCTSLSRYHSGVDIEIKKIHKNLTKDRVTSASQSKISLITLTF